VVGRWIKALGPTVALNQKISNLVPRLMTAPSWCEAKMHDDMAESPGAAKKFSLPFSFFDSAADSLSSLP
jgi:hypothetical protein